MTNFDKLRNMSLSEFARFLESFDRSSLCFDTFEKECCYKCSAESDSELVYCDKYGYCPYIPNRDDESTDLNIIKWWLEKEAK